MPTVMSQALFLIQHEACDENIQTQLLVMLIQQLLLEIVIDL